MQYFCIVMFTRTLKKIEKISLDGLSCVIIKFISFKSLKPFYIIVFIKIEHLSFIRYKFKRICSLSFKNVAHFLNIIFFFIYVYIYRNKCQTDYDIIQKNHKFLWEEEDKPITWEENLAKRYYDKLYKEYCICDLSLYKMGKVKKYG